MTYSVGPDDVPRLRDEHAYLERQLLAMIQLAEAGQSCVAAWAIFSRDFEEHMRYQENLLFPAFARSGADTGSWGAGFVAEHEDLRQQCYKLGSALLQSPRNLEPLRQLARQLSEHKAQEGQVLVPWLTSLKPQGLSPEIMRLIVAAPEYRNVQGA